MEMHICVHYVWSVRPPAPHADYGGRLQPCATHVCATNREDDFVSATIADSNVGSSRLSTSPLLLALRCDVSWSYLSLIPGPGAHSYQEYGQVQREKLGRRNERATVVTVLKRHHGPALYRALHKYRVAPTNIVASLDRARAIVISIALASVCGECYGHRSPTPFWRCATFYIVLEYQSLHREPATGQYRSLPQRTTVQKAYRGTSSLREMASQLSMKQSQKVTQCRLALLYSKGLKRTTDQGLQLVSEGRSGSKFHTPRLRCVNASPSDGLTYEMNTIAGSVTPAIASQSAHAKEPSIEYISQHTFQPTQQFNEFVPGRDFVPQQVDQHNQLQNQLAAFGDPFISTQALQQSISGLDGTQQQINPYAQVSSAVAGQNYFQDTSGYKHPLNYHLYASIGPKREKTAPYQRASSDFFIPDDLREDLQRKSEATLQTFANSTLPHSVEYFHSLVALDTNTHKGPSTFDYPSWVYKATSSRDGNTYVLRRIEGYRLTSEAAIRSIHAWKRINSASVVRVHDAFTGRWFGDSSLIVVTDYHPTAQTVAEKYFSTARLGIAGRANSQTVPEQDLWGYLVQLASALNTIHDLGLAAQALIASKVLITSKNRLRLNCCGVLDVVRHDRHRPKHELRRADLEDLGRLMLGIATRSPTAHQSAEKALQTVGRVYSERFRACLAWLMTPPSSNDPTQVDDFSVNTLLVNIADKLVVTMDNTLHLEDELTTDLMRELENGRLVRLLAKLNVILERPDLNSSTTSSSAGAILNQPSSSWSETGERYYLKLFRDYVFHQVDHDGKPVLDLGHIVTSLNKLDAGIDEKIQLVSRDEQNVFVLSYKEVKRGFESAWAELSKSGSGGRA
nr:pab-dependent poly(a)-specific ribonuclease subunit pan3 [Quercus suber]